MTDQEQPVRTVLPDGWVFHEAQGAARFAERTGTSEFDLNRNDGSMAHVALGARRQEIRARAVAPEIPAELAP
ncbi:hypothetical protein Ga0609869_003243 [Rhodovulum iodosum]|uniref:DUF2188 domain-containing protein n=1 Tax=Rhodovulum iodosum TaxID=68291 RepID=A0ABV3XWZ1_9RHOB|nr:hypothetical protein [Rhodovulum robiginosum]RSK34076.1 hypothetical protein EJA01_08075 [Rhodovulum robiginosum]